MDLLPGNVVNIRLVATLLWEAEGFYMIYDLAWKHVLPALIAHSFVEDLCNIHGEMTWFN